MKDKGMIVSMRDTQKTKQAMDNIVKQYRKAPLKKNTAFAARRKKSMMGLASVSYTHLTLPTTPYV